MQNRRILERAFAGVGARLAPALEADTGLAFQMISEIETVTGRIHPNPDPLAELGDHLRGACGAWDLLCQLIGAAVDAPERPESVRARVEWLFHDTSLVTDEIVDVRRAIYTQPGYVRTMENTAALRDPEVRRPYHWDPSWLGRIQCPTLVMWTSRDPTGTIDEWKVLGDWIPDAELTVIDGAGYWPQWEKVDEFNQLHVDFLARLRAGGH